MLRLCSTVRSQKTALTRRENNPNYVRPRISGLTEKKSLDDGWFTLVPDNEVKNNGEEPSEMKEDELLLCSPTVRGWSFGNKLWRGFSLSRRTMTG